MNIELSPSHIDYANEAFSEEINDNKVGEVSIHFFNSYIASFVSKVALYIGVGAAVVAFSPKVVTLPSSFAKTILSAVFPMPVVAIVGSIGAALFIVEILRKKKELLYEISLLYTLSGNHDWWNQITPNLVLGAIPLGPDHADRIKQENVDAVLTLLDNFELEEGIAQPISSEQWLALEITHLHIEAVDFKGVPAEQIHQGVEFLEEQILQGKKVYVHCKAGRGRSATVIVAYLLKQHYNVKDTDFETAFQDIHEKVKSKRPQISLNVRQRATIRDYYQEYCV